MRAFPSSWISDFSGEDAGKYRGVGGQDGEEEDSTFEPGASLANSRLGGSSEVFASEEPFDGAGDADSAPREGARGGGQLLPG